MRDMSHRSACVKECGLMYTHLNVFSFLHESLLEFHLSCFGEKGNVTWENMETIV